jgi:hypothetical protein
MKRTTLLSFLLIGGIATTYAQDNVAQAIMPAPSQEKMFEHQVGVQMNQLIRQVFNFGNNNNVTTNNPYLLTYTLTHAKTGVGLRLGAGYDQRSFVDDDGVNSRDGKINDINLRAGLEKSFDLGGGFTAGAGADFVWAKNTNDTKSLLRSVDTTIIITKSEVGNMGGGAMAWLRYSISRKILVGTETSFYYRTGKIKQDVTTTKRDLTQPAQPWVSTTTSIDNTESEGVFSVPIVFYLIVRF